MLPYVDAQDRDVARVSNASVQGIIIVWRGLNGQCAILGHHKPCPACMDLA